MTGLTTISGDLVQERGPPVLKGTVSSWPFPYPEVPARQEHGGCLVNICGMTPHFAGSEAPVQDLGSFSGNRLVIQLQVLVAFVAERAVWSSPLSLSLQASPHTEAQENTSPHRPYRVERTLVGLEFN